MLHSSWTTDLKGVFEAADRDFLHHKLRTGWTPSYCWQFTSGSLDVHKIIHVPKMRFISQNR